MIFLVTDFVNKFRNGFLFTFANIVTFSHKYYYLLATSQEFFLIVETNTDIQIDIQDYDTRATLYTRFSQMDVICF